MESLLCKPQQDLKRLEKFNGMNYKCWSMKIMYQLTATKFLYVLNTPYPQDGTSEGQLSEAQQKWVEDYFVCHSMILNAISNALFNVFHKSYPEYELWATIERRYANKDARNKSFLINKYIDFKMVDSKSIVDQVNELNEIASQCADVDEPIFETFQDNMHNVENSSSSKISKSKVKKFNNGNKGFSNEKRKRFESKDASNKKKRGPCYVCGKMGHLARVCKFHKGKKEEVNVLEEDEMVAVLTKILIVDKDND
ncbi:uncharacterized protein LOC131174633 [Hevea brasiliensis]|uniref:uncharacterized protein LOC131174633 n=1 Tax=Hevea brasiliensis TaxID=3981 RepID=UPI0025ECB1B8|nr:uncharacterized protein LOC131174633 [Hevea brasiliensis]